MFARLPNSVTPGTGYAIVLEKLPEHPHFNFNFLKDDSLSTSNEVRQFLQISEAGPSNRDLLSIYFTAKVLEGFEESSAASFYWTPVKLLYRTLCHLRLIPSTKSELQLHAKLKKIETKFQTLQKNYNARCCRGGEKQRQVLEEFLLKPFQMQPAPVVSPAAAPSTVYTPAPSPPRTIPVTSPLIKSPIVIVASPCPQSVETGVQVNSPQIKTTPAIHRRLTATKRELFKVHSSVGRKTDELSRQAEKHEHLKSKIRQKENKIIELNNKCKQIANSTDGKRVKALEKEVGQLNNQIKELKATIVGLLDSENQLADSLVSATNKYIDSERRVRAVKAGKRRATQKLSDIRRHILALCSNLKASSGDTMVMDLCASLQQIPDIDKNTSAILKEIVSGLTAPLPTKEKGAFKEHIAVLAMQLQLLGVPQNTVGEVMNECSKRIYNRCLSDKVSARTAGRMIRQGGILSDAQLALTLSDTSSSGLRVGQDTTTRGGVEHVATAWAGRTENNEVFNMQSRVAWLPNHIAETQLEHIKCVIEKSNDLLKTLDLEPQTKASLAYVVDFMGDHVNSKLVRLLRENHLSDLEELIENGELTDNDREVFSELFYSACQMHSGAKVSRSFYEGMRAIEPPDLAKTFGKYGIRRGAGNTFDSLGARVVEFASTQFSPDQSNTADFNWSGVFRGWCDEHGHPYIKLDFVNKNRHYRHEHNSGRLIELTDSILHFYNDQLSTRDDGQTLRNKDQLVFECLQNDEVRSQLTAADALDAMFYKPFMAMLKAEETDVITVGPYIRRAYEFLNQAGNEEEFARSVLSGLSLLYEGEHLRRDGKDFRKKPVGISVYGNSIVERSVLYLMAGCQTGAKGLRKISSEYFDGGHYFEPSVKQSVLLSGFDAHSDRLESNLGQFSQQRSRMPHARIQTITSHVAMRANKTVAAIGKDERLMSCLPKVRKLERNESEVTVRQQLSSLSQANKAHRNMLRKALETRQNTRLARRTKLKTQVQRDGMCCNSRDVDALCNKYKRKVAQRGVLRQHITFFKGRHKDAIVPEHQYLFRFSKNKHQLDNAGLVKNLKRIVAEYEIAVTIENSIDNPAEGQHTTPGPTYPSVQDVQAMEPDTAFQDVQAMEPDTAFVNTANTAPAKKKKKCRKEFKIKPFIFTETDTWVVILFEDRWYPGRIDKILDENNAEVTYLKPLKESLDCQHFMWPNAAVPEVYRTNSKAVIYSDFSIRSVGNPVRYFTLSKFKEITKVYNKLV